MDNSNTSTPASLPLGCHLLRKNVFDSGSDDTSDEELLQRRKPTMLALGEPLIPPSSPESCKKYTVVLDLDETVVYGRDGPLYSRAFLQQFLSSIAKDYEVIAWTASDRDYAKRVLGEINKDLIIEHLVYRHDKWFQNEDSYTKDLKKLGRSMDFTIIIENSPECIRQNPQNGIIVPEFAIPLEKEIKESKNGKKRARTDQTLNILVNLLQELSSSGKTVPDYLKSCSLLQRKKISSVEGKNNYFYFLDSNVKRHKKEVDRKDKVRE